MSSTVTVTGCDVRPGQTVKDEGRWFTVMEFDDSNPFAREGVRVAKVTLAGGKDGYRAILDEIAYPVRVAGGGRAATVIQFRDYDAKQEVVYQVRYVKREYGGWTLVRADNGRHLGWLVKSYGTEDWSAHVNASAFKGTGPDDEGHLLDKVDTHLFNGKSQCVSESIGLDSKRDQAAELIIRRLHEKRAPALGFAGPHWGVSRWEDRRA